MGKVAFVVTCLYQLYCLSVCALVALIDSDNPPLGCKGFSEVVKFEVFVARVSVSYIVVTFGLAVGSIDLPGSVVAQFIHQTILHGGEHHVVDSVAVSGHVVLLFDVRVHSSTDTNHP